VKGMTRTCRIDDALEGSPASDAGLRAENLTVTLWPRVLV